MSKKGPKALSETVTEPSDLWVAVVEFDKIALAVGLLLGMTVMAVNSFVMEVTSPLIVLSRALLTFVIAWLAVFVLLFAFRQYTLRQMAVAGQLLDETVGNDEEIQSNESAT